MSKKKHHDHQSSQETNDETILNLDEVKEMTVGQVVRKQQDIKDGIEDDDNVLDRYIKQHREDIEAKKFETIVNEPAISEDMIEETEDLSETIDVSKIVEEHQPKSESDLQIHKVAVEQEEEATPASPVVEAQPSAINLEEDMFGPEESNKKKMLVWAALATVFVSVLAVAFVWMNLTNGSQKETASSSSASSTKTSSSSEDAKVTAFEKLYASFFTDSSLTKLKNSEFGKLNQLKAALDKIGTSHAGYKAAKAKYDVLEKAIKAIQDINSKFDKPAIVDGELDTTANAKAGAKFEAVSTGLSAVDSLLASAVNLGRTQTPASSSAAPANNGGGSGQAAGDAATPNQTPSAPAASPAPAAPAAPAATPSTPSNPGWVTIDGIVYGMEVPAGVTLQRDLSRVPYNQSAIDDVNNEAWNFNPGVLEKIIAISQQRGYITGNQYIIEKVNIINGRGYYNLFKPDGTYLFSINCKTGYFVGNAAGHSDDLDF